MNILVLLPMTDARRRKLEAAAPGAQFFYGASGGADVSDECLAAAEVVIGNLPLQRLAVATSLRWMQLNSAGAEAYAQALPPEVALTNASGAYGLAISEHMLAVTLALQKNLPRYWRNQQQALWKDEGPAQSIYGCRALVVGLGDIGGEFARKLHLLGARVSGIRRSVAPCPAWLDELCTLNDLDRLLPEADLVALSLPNTPATTRVMDARRLALMKPGSLFLNVGRGTAVDTDALVNALQNGPLAAASLDVTDPEPLPPEHPLWRLENCLITPHVSGGYHLTETLERIVDIAARNLARYTAGQPLENCVNRATGYRVSQV